MLLAVAIGAFGAHALATILQQNASLSTFEIANRYHFYHGLGLILVSVIYSLRTSLKHMWWVSGLMFVGTLLFSGSLYLFAILMVREFAFLTPLGGVILMLAWLLLIADLYRNVGRSSANTTVY